MGKEGKSREEEIEKGREEKREGRCEEVQKGERRGARTREGQIHGFPFSGSLPKIINSRFSGL